MATKVKITGEKIVTESYKSYYKFYDKNITIEIACQDCKEKPATTILRCNNHSIDIDGDLIYHCNVSEFICDSCFKKFKEFFFNKEESDFIYCCGQGVRIIEFGSLTIYNK